MELRHLRDFVAVAQDLHFSRAATRLHVAQPALTRQIKNLEEEIGVQLFNRSNRRVTLTREGRAFFESAKSVLDLTERSVEAIRRASRGETATFSIGHLPSFGFQPLTATLGEFRRLRPSVTVHLCNLTGAEQVQALQERSIDLGFVVSSEFLAGTGLRGERVACCPAVAAVPEESLLARKSWISLADLKRSTLVGLSEELHPDYEEWIAGISKDFSLAPPVGQRAHDEMALLALVAAGAGVALLPEQVKSLPHGGVVLKALKPPIMVECCIAWRKDDASQLLRDYMQIVRKASGVNAR